jgi:hypothetical protein
MPESHEAGFRRPHSEVRQDASSSGIAHLPKTILSPTSFGGGRTMDHDGEECTMQQPGLHGRHRDQNGEVSRKHGNTLVNTLRKIYGQHFAPGLPDDEKLSDVLAMLDQHSLSQLVHDHEAGTLEGHIQRHS